MRVADELISASFGRVVNGGRTRLLVRARPLQTHSLGRIAVLVSVAAELCCLDCRMIQIGICGIGRDAASSGC